MSTGANRKPCPTRPNPTQVAKRRLCWFLSDYRQIREDFFDESRICRRDPGGRQRLAGLDKGADGFYESMTDWLCHGILTVEGH